MRSSDSDNEQEISKVAVIIYLVGHVTTERYYSKYNALATDLWTLDNGLSSLIV